MAKPTKQHTSNPRIWKHVRTTAVTTAIICASKPPEVLEASEQPSENSALASALASAPSHVQIPKKQTDQQEPKTQRSRIPPESRSILEEHFNNDPYPTGRDIDIIAQLSNLEKKTVKNWFNNTRSRRSVQDNQANLTPFNSVELDSTTPSFQGPQLSTSWRSKRDTDAMSVGSKSSSNLSIERYLVAPLDEEPASAAAIKAALAQEADVQPHSHCKNALNKLPQVPDDSCSAMLVGNSRPLSDDGLISKRRVSAISSRHSSASGGSASSYGSSTSSFGRARRRGRKRWHHAPYATSSKAVEGLNQKEEDEDDQGRNVAFFCTFCQNAFTAKYEWKRHEESVHMPQKTWICCHQEAPAPTWCPFCRELLPTEEHLAKHRYQECRNKPEAQRTFSRKDHLLQHIRSTHLAQDVSNHPPVYPNNAFLKLWECSPPPLESDNPALHCGFCGRWFLTWSKRSEHVARHFKASITMSTWWPGRIHNDCELENVLIPFYSRSPHFCRYCHKQFPDLATAQKLHSCCKLFSCSFLPNPESIFGFGMMPQEKYCHLCDFDIEYLHENASHLIRQHAETHKYRQCHQRIYYSSSDFWNHLRRFHCEGRSAYFRGEQIVSSWMRVMAAVFEPTDQAAGALATQLLHFGYERVSSTIEAQDSHICSTIPQRHQRNPHLIISDPLPKELTEETCGEKLVNLACTLDPLQCPGDIPKTSLFSDLAHPGRKSPLPRDVPFHVNSVRSIMAQSTRRIIGASN